MRIHEQMAVEDRFWKFLAKHNHTKFMLNRCRDLCKRQPIGSRLMILSHYIEREPETFRLFTKYLEEVSNEKNR